MTLREEGTQLVEIVKQLYPIKTPTGTLVKLEKPDNAVKVSLRIFLVVITCGFLRTLMVLWLL